MLVLEMMVGGGVRRIESNITKELIQLLRKAK